MDKVNVLMGQNKPQEEVTTNRRITQTDIIPGAVKQRHLEQGLFVIKMDIAANLPSDGLKYGAFYATDTNYLYLWNGTAWKSVLLT